MTTEEHVKIAEYHLQVAYTELGRINLRTARLPEVSARIQARLDSIAHYFELLNYKILKTGPVTKA